MIGTFLMSSCVFAAPNIFDPTPANNSFYGRGVIDISINVTGEYMDTNHVRFFVISEDAYLHDEAWDNYTLPCTSYGTDAWTCGTKISFAVVETDTLEFFYFTVNDTIGSLFVLGNSTDPMTFKLDRTAPEITFEEPTDGVYISGNANVEVSISDAVSGVNESTVKLSDDNSTWTNMTNYIGYYNTTSYSNNITKTIFVTACDNVNNCDTANINVTIDNEFPRLIVISPSSEDILAGTKTFTVNASDTYSGLIPGEVKATIISTEYGFTCSAITCHIDVDTTNHPDNDYDITFTAADNAGNVNTSIIPVEIKNAEPGVRLRPEGYLSGTVTMNAIISESDIVESVSMEIKKGSAVSTVEMSCNAQNTLCTYSLDTTDMTESPYTLTAIVENVMNHTIKNEITVIVDNTNPVISIDSPDFVTGTFTIEITVTDANPHPGRVTATINGNSLTLSCTGATGSVVCSAQYDSTSLSQISNTLSVTAIDYADHSVTTSKTFTINNDPPELTSLKVDPTHTETFGNVSFTANMYDAYSGVDSVTITIDNMGTESTLTLSKVSSAWYAIGLFESFGTYRVKKLDTTDNAGNSESFLDVGYFYIGPLTCGDGICQQAENYCLCRDDCSLPACSGNDEIGCSSGIPICIAPGTCGDGICSNIESCSSCSVDCGNCTQIQRVILEKVNFVDKLPAGQTQSPDDDGAWLSFSDTNINIFGSDPNLFLYIILIVSAILLAAVVFWWVKRDKEYDGPTFLSGK